MNLNKEYWEARYEKNQTGWDVGIITAPLKTYIDQWSDKTAKILIPGAGNGHEFDYLIGQGFSEVYIVDIAKKPLENIRKRNPKIDAKYFIESDFFDIDNQFNLIIEQTFFCALNPNLRMSYSNQVLKLLKQNGTLAGVLFNFPITNEGPPFGGSTEEYKNLFSEKFSIKTLEKCHNSIKPRAGKELFIILKKQ
uniref:methyltransferase domain-containing protein n=1 Tax=Flavobacterium sp. TaxID=239 RepID=UPI0040499F9D